MFCCALLYVRSSIAIILMGKRQLVALLILSSWCLAMVGRLFLAMPRGCLRFVIVVFPDHTDLLFLHKCMTKQDRNDINDSQKKHRLGRVSQNILLEGLNWFNSAPTSILVQMWIKTHGCLICMKDSLLTNASSPRTYFQIYIYISD